MRVVPIALFLGLLVSEGVSFAQEQEAWVPPLESVATVKTFLASGPERDEVCEPVLGSLRWMGMSRNGRSHFTIEGQSAQGFMLGNVSEFRENFFGDGDVTLFAISDIYGHFPYTWIIAAPAEEVASIRARLARVAKAEGGTTLENEMEALAGDFPHIVLDQDDSILSTSPLLMGAAPSPKFKAPLFDILNAEPFLVRRAGRTYLATVSRGDLGGPTAAVFRPERDGRLTPLCTIAAPDARWRYLSDTTPLTEEACPAAVDADGDVNRKEGWAEPERETLSWFDHGVSNEVEIIRLLDGSTYLHRDEERADRWQSTLRRLGDATVEKIRSNRAKGLPPLDGIDLPDGMDLADDAIDGSDVFYWRERPYVKKHLTWEHDSDTPWIAYVAIGSAGQGPACTFVPQLIPPPGVIPIGK